MVNNLYTFLDDKVGFILICFRIKGKEEIEMSADNLVVSSSDLRELSTTFSTLSDDLSTLYDSIVKDTDDLEGRWSGVASTTFVENIRNTYTTFENAISYLSEVSTNLTTAADNYDEVEQQNSVS